MAFPEAEGYRLPWVGLSLLCVPAQCSYQVELKLTQVAQLTVHEQVGLSQTQNYLQTHS